jgi:hypothetical protein
MCGNALRFQSVASSNCNWKCDANNYQSCGSWPNYFFNVYTTTGKLYFENILINFLIPNIFIIKDITQTGTPCLNGGSYFTINNTGVCLCTNQYEGIKCQFGK